MGSDMYETFVKAGTLLQDGHRLIPSEREMARLMREDPDKVRRDLEKLEKKIGAKLIDHEGGRYFLSRVGGKVLSNLVDVFSVADSGECEAEVVTVLTDPFLVEAVIVDACWPTFLGLWGSATHLRFCAQDGLVRKTVFDGGSGSFGIVLADQSETFPQAEALGQPLSWCLLVPRSHRLAQQRGEISTELLAPEDKILIPGAAMDGPALDAFINARGRANVVECESVAHLVARGVGLAIIPDVYGKEEPEAFAKLALPELVSVRLRLILPRGGTAALSERAQSLVECIRRVIETRFVPVVANQNDMAEAGCSPASVETEVMS